MAVTLSAATPSTMVSPLRPCRDDTKSAALPRSTSATRRVFTRCFCACRFSIDDITRNSSGNNKSGMMIMNTIVRRSRIESISSFLNTVAMVFIRRPRCGE
jgi:hypothetical protein